MTRGTAIAPLAVLVVLGWLAMLAGWRRRAARQARDLGLPSLPAPPTEPGAALTGDADGVYLGATTAGNWLDRVTACGLGARSAATMAVTAAGVSWLRQGAPDVFAAAPDLLGARRADGIAGKVVPPQGIVVVSWRLGDVALDTGFRPRTPGDGDRLVAAVERLVRGDGGCRVSGPGAVLVLEDGRSWRGRGYGAVGTTVGEAVFATGMTGYQETLTDPSYHRQVVVMTAPHIGNTGVNDEDGESARIWVAGFVVRDPARRASSWRARRELDDELRAAGVVGISGVDTRAVTRHLRERGAMRAGVFSGSEAAAPVEALVDVVRAAPPMTGADLAGEVTTPQPYVVPAVGARRLTVAAVDLGIKTMTPRRMAERGIEVHVLPASATLDDVLATGADGVFFSNGPGDPAASTGPVELLRGVLGAGLPFFGICFGNQLLGRALGLGTYKLGYGHRGINQPVLDRATGRVEVTAHNHGFAVDAPLDAAAGTDFGRVEVSHVGLNDGVVEGLRCLDVPAFSVQYHPEAAAGPHDAGHLFDRFADLMVTTPRGDHASRLLTTTPTTPRGGTEGKGRG